MKLMSTINNLLTRMNSSKPLAYILGCLFVFALPASAAILLETSYALTASDPTQTGRLTRNGIPSDWSVAKAFPGITNANTVVHYHTFTIPAAALGSAGFVQITVDDPNGAVFAAGYVDSFTPNAAATNRGLDVNFLGDQGTTGNPFTDPGYFQVVVPAGHDLVINVNDPSTNNSGLGKTFRLIVETFTDTQFTDPAPVSTLIAAKDQPVPGDPTSTFVKFGIPSLDGNQPGFLATIQPSSGKSVPAIIGGNPTGVLVRAGDPAPDVAGAEFAKFKEPVFGGGHLAFQATVAHSGDAGIWSNALGPLRLIARESDDAPGVTGGKFQSFASLALPQTGGAIFVAKLKGGNGLGLWREDAAGPMLLLLTGEMVTVDAGPARKIKSLAVLASVKGSPGQRRFTSDGTVEVRLSFTNGTQAIVEAPGTSNMLFLDALTGGSPSAPAGAVFKKFGIPAASDQGHAFLGTLQRGPGGITKTGDSVLFASVGVGPFNGLVGESDAALRTGSIFTKFDDPALGGANALAFLGTTKNKTTALFTTAFGALELIARNGGAAPEVAKGRFAAISAFALPDGLPARGPVFTAKLHPGGGVKKTNNAGLWASGTSGEVALLVRTGDSLAVPGGAKKIKAITALGSVSGSPGQGRAVNASGKIIYRLTIEGGQAIVATQVP